MTTRMGAVWGTVAGLWLTMTACAAPATRPAVPPPFVGAAVPTPPHQRDPWARPAKTTLPPTLLDAAARLFDQGVADPRGGEYRAVGIVTGSCWGGAGVTDTHAWVLPAGADPAHRFAVAWNGLVYPCVTVGGPADLAGDIHGLIDADVRSRAAWAKGDRHGTPYTGRLMLGTSEGSAVSPESPTPIKAVLLVRAGETALAEAYWPVLAATAVREGSADHGPYLSLAGDWAWHAFDHAVCAHMRGDDVVGRDAAQLLTTAVPLIEAAAASLNFPRPMRMGRDGKDAVDPPYVGFVDNLPDLLADERRRVAGGRVERVLDDPKRYPDRAKRVAGLVRDLEAVAARQWGQPGGVNVVDDPVCAALVADGPAAVDPLIDCFAHDDRLTRSVSFGRDFFRSRDLIPVRSAAYAILKQIVQADSFGPVTDGHGGPGTRAAAAEEIRAYWARSRGKPLAERWLDVLADDAAGPDRWIEAAGRIVEPTNVQRTGGGWVSTTPVPPGRAVPIKGESLRGRRDPGVTELMARRVPAVAAVNDGWLFAQSSAADLSLDLQAWDARAAVPTLREQLKRCMAASDADATHLEPQPNSAQSTQTTEQMARDVGRLTTALAADGDAAGTGMYRAWVVRQTPAGPGGNVGALVQPLWRYPADAMLAAAADELFNGPASPWRCLPTAAQFRDWGPMTLMASPIYGVPAFVTHVVRNLDDLTVVGAASVSDHQLSVDVGGSTAGYGGVNVADPLLPKAAAAKVPVRVCDWYAWSLSQLDGAPPFELYWPAAARDAQRPRLAAFLRRWASRFRYSPVQATLDDFGQTDADAGRMTFPRLDRPATAADVAAATAIFRLGGGPVRTVPLPDWPARAKWTTYRDVPVQYQGATDPKTGVSQCTNGFRNEGVVWQAEEVQVGGRWERFYGFVGPHTIAKVPAEQIEFIKGR